MSEIHLVTGGAGFIGSHLVEQLVRQGRRVRVLDDFSTGVHSNLGNVETAIEVFTGDLGLGGDVDRAMKDVDVVYHLGAIASVPRSVEAPLETHRVGVTGTLHVLDAARRMGARRVIYAASSSAYGGISANVQRETDPVDPLSPYAAAKLAGEFYARAFAATYGLETVSLRFFNIFGPRQRDDSPYTGVIALFSAAMLMGRRPTIYGDGLQSRDFTFVANVVHALQRAAEAPNVNGKVFNIGTGRSITLLELVEQLNRLLGTKHSAVHGPVRTGDVRHSRADMARARAELSYNPSVTFEEGLKQTVQWYQSQK